MRGLCLGLPETAEKEAWGGPTFRVKGRMFAMYMDHHHGENGVALWCNASADARDALVEASPRHFFVPPYMGPRGWIGIRLDRRLGWRRIAELVRESYCRSAPKRLAHALEAGDA